MFTQHGGVTRLSPPPSAALRHPVLPSASNTSTRSCRPLSRCCRCTSFPTLKGTGGHWGGMDTLAAYSANTLHRAGSGAGPSPLNSRSPTMGTAITAWLHKPGRGPTQRS
ncbi:hypothetical protein CgunFtcFv8_025087 [Champsocephalus gunnari]|uniref:Uncharacterized protein n=1 Tax=Champsocephalus gunnari TaxID=52237 RepID=A0AAN8DHX1_CHAGU|nr:hypothetical protein CgunFtcFv8_025087 [Champsocephalus gunnari]